MSMQIGGTMKKSKVAVKEINKILVNDEISLDTKAQLLEIKKSIEFGETNFTNGLQETKLLVFYRNYIDKIAIWLHLPPIIVKKKLSNKDFTEVENKLILTNMLLEMNESDDDDDDEYLY